MIIMGFNNTDHFSVEDLSEALFADCFLTLPIVSTHTGVMDISHTY